MRKQNNILYPNIKTLSKSLIYENEEEHIEDKATYCHKIGSALLKNVNDKSVNLFSALDEEEDFSEDTNISLNFFNTKGKLFNLSTRQQKIILALSQCISSRTENKAVSDYINNLPEKFLYNRTLIPPLTVKFDKRDLAKNVYGNPRIGGYEVKAIEKDLIQLSQCRCIFKIKCGTETLTINDHYLTYKSITLDRGGEIIRDVSQVTIGDIFLYDINSDGGYQLAPNSILSLWNQHLNDRYLTSFLFFELLSKRGIKISFANKTAADKRKELKRSKKSDTAIDKAAAEIKEKGLTYSITLSTLLSSLRENKRYFYAGGRVRPKNIQKDLEEAKDGFLNMGLITKYYTVTSASGEPKYCFVINENWLSDEVKRLQMKEEESNETPN